jgi:iron complex outermembrane receptor protein
VLVGLEASAAAQLQLGVVDVQGRRPPPARVDLDEPGFVTVVDAAEPTARTASVADLIDRQAGVRIRSYGGLGTFTSVSLRGSDANEVAVLVDGVPLSRAASGTIDLSMLPADALERIEIHRGTPGIELGGEAIGGVINLVTKRGQLGNQVLPQISVGGGSFGARSASASLSAGQKGLAANVTAGYRGTNGDFTYYDNAGTLFDQSDDRFSVRHNNGFDQGTLDASVGNGPARRDRVGWSAAVHGFIKRQGVPGFGFAGAESLNSALTTGRILVDAGLVRPSKRADVRLDANMFYERNWFTNLRGDRVGPYGPAATDAEAGGAGLRGRVDVPLGKYNLLVAVADARGEHRRPWDLLIQQRAGLPSSRFLGGVGLSDEIRLWRNKLLIIPALRVDGSVSDLTDVSTERHYGSADTFVSPRLQIRLRVHPAVTLRAGGGRFVRFPTLIEQFGDGAFILPGQVLRPESAWGGDAGLAVDGRRGKVAGSLEATFFARYVSDTIAFVPAGNAYAAANIGDARILGSEARARLEADLPQRFALRVTVDYTFLDSVNLSDLPGALGNPLPGRPRNQLFGRADLGWGPATLWYAVDWIDDSFRDAQAYNVVPGRVLHSLGASLRAGAFSVVVEVDNLADLRIVDLPLGGLARAGQTSPYPLIDFFNYPLPGRAVYATLTWAPRPRSIH